MYYIELKAGNNISVGIHSVLMWTNNETLRNIYISEYHMY